MATYHLTCKIGKRTVNGGNAISHLSYITGEKYKDEEQGKIKDCRENKKKKQVIYSNTLIPEHAPSEYINPAILWNSVEKMETAKNARLYREFEMSLPIEFQNSNLEAQIELCENMAKTFTNDGRCVSYAIHNNDKNPHVHFMTTVRSIGENGEWLAKSRKVYLDKNGNEAKTKEDRIYDKKKKAYKCRKESTNNWDSIDILQEIRKRWEILENYILEKAGYNEYHFVDCRSHKERGIELEPQIHTTRKNMQIPELQKINNEIKARNKEFIETKKNNDIKNKENSILKKIINKELNDLKDKEIQILNEIIDIKINKNREKTNIKDNEQQINNITSNKKKTNPNPGGGSGGQSSGR